MSLIWFNKEFIWFNKDDHGIILDDMGLKRFHEMKLPGFFLCDSKLVSG